MNKKIIRTLLIIITICCYILPSYSLDTTDNKYDTNDQILILNNGAEYKGSLIKIDDSTVEFQTPNDRLSINKKDVAKINFSQSRLYSNVQNISQIKDEDIKNIFDKSQSYTNKKSDNRYVTILSRRKYKILNENKVRCIMTNAIKIISEQGKNESTQFFTYQKNTQTAKLIYAITIQPDGKVFSVDESAVNEEPVYNKYPLYDIQQRVKFGHKNVDVGSLLIWQAEYDIKIESPLSPFYTVLSFMDSEPTLNYEVTVNHPEDIIPYYEIYNDFFKKIKPVIKTNKTCLSITIKNVPAYRIDEGETPSYNILLPKVFVGMRIKGSNQNEAQIATNKYDKTFFSSIISNDIKDYADKILKNKTTTNIPEMADTFYYHLNRNIELASLPLSTTGYIPLSDDILCYSSYLSPLDKTYLFARLLQSKNIESHFIFYGSDDTVVPKNVFSIKNFNGVLCEAIINGQSYYYSFYGKNYSTNVIPISASNVKSICVSNNQIITKTKKIAPESNTYRYDMECQLSEDCSLTLQQKTSICGIGMTSYRELRYLSNAQLQTYMNKRALLFGKNVTVLDYKFSSDFSDYSAPIEFTEKYKVNNFAYASGNKLLFKISDLGFNVNAGSVSKQKRNYPYDINNISVSKVNVSIQLPSDYKVIYVPSPIKMTFNDGSCFAQYNMDEKENTLNLTMEIKFGKRYVNPKDYKAFKKWIEKRAMFTSEWIILEKIIGK